MSKPDFESLSPKEQICLIESGCYIGSSRIEGVDASLFLTKGNYWVEVYYEPDGKTIGFMCNCPEHRLSLFVEGHDIVDMA